MFSSWIVSSLVLVSVLVTAEKKQIQIYSTMKKVKKCTICVCVNTNSCGDRINAVVSKEMPCASVEVLIP